MTSKHLMHLEKHLGTRLLNRSSRSLSLTESGRLFFERCKVILEEVEEAESAVGSVSGVPRGTLRVSFPSWAATQLMVELVATYRQRYPEVVLDLSFEDRVVDLIEEGYDLAIRRCQRIWDSIHEVLSTAVAPFYMILLRRPITVHEKVAISLPWNAQRDCQSHLSSKDSGH
jgi:DNA-binding transcriptional LysR family regulator